MESIGKRLDGLCAALQPCGVKKNVPLSACTSFHIGGPAALLLDARSEDALAFALAMADRFDCPAAILGNGSNVLAADAGFRGLLIRPAADGIRFDGARAAADAGAALSTLARRSVQAGLTGLECLCGIPGTVGGAIAMNAGAYGAEIRDTLARVRFLANGVFSDEAVDSAQFAYRQSPYRAPERTVLSAEFALQADDGFAAKRMANCLQKRKEKQPLSLPSAGSVFKRPAGHFAGALIEQSGLKGRRVGGAEVSALHAGFIVNTGGASCADVLGLIGLIRDTVRSETGVLLECEIQYLGTEGFGCIC